MIKTKETKNAEKSAGCREMAGVLGREVLNVKRLRYIDADELQQAANAVRPGWSLQEMAEELRPETYHANTKIRIGDLEKAVGKAGMISLEDAGIVKTHVYVSGELEVISRAVTEAKPRAELQEGED